MKPHVSIVIPTYNRSTIVRRAIDSVLGQTFRDFEIVVVDDGSTDDTRGALSDYPECVRYVRQDNAGPAAARNHGMRIARGDFIGFLDSDDVYLSHNIAAHLECFGRNPGAGLVYAGAEVVDAEGKRIKEVRPRPVDRGLVLERLARYNFITSSTVLMRREAMDFAGPMNVTLWFAEDWFYWMRVASRFPIDFVGEVLVRYQRNRVSLSHGTPLTEIADRTMQMFAVAFADPDLGPRLRPLRREIHRRAYAEYAAMALERFQLREARTFAWRALAAQPEAWACYPLLLKSCLAPGLLARLRRWRRGG